MDRRAFIGAIGGGITGLSLASNVRPQAKNGTKGDQMLVYVGTYTSGPSKSEGIYVCRLDVKTAALSLQATVPGVADPSFLVVARSRKYLYAVNETEEFEGKKSGAVSSFAVDRATGDLRFLNKRASLGGAPCHLSLSEGDGHLLVANYAGGNVAVLPIKGDGSLEDATAMKQQSGTGPNRERQESAHAHSITLDRGDRFAAACDLGADKIFIYRFDKRTGNLTANERQPFFQTRPGAGPRHFAFHEGGKFAFVINELNSTVTSLAYDEKAGTLTEIQTLSTLPAGWSQPNSCADLHISPNGAFLYGSNRGHDSIVSYAIDKTRGTLSLIEHTPTQGKTPRNFAIDPSGKYLLAANQRSDSIVSFSIDQKTGKLTPTGNTLSVPTPVCLKFMTIS